MNFLMHSQDRALTVTSRIHGFSTAEQALAANHMAFDLLLWNSTGFCVILDTQAVGEPCSAWIIPSSWTDMDGTLLMN